MKKSDKRRRGQLCPVVSLDTALPEIIPAATLVTSSQEERNRRFRSLTKNKSSDHLIDTDKSSASKHTDNELGIEGVGLSEKSKHKRRIERNGNHDPATPTIDRDKKTGPNGVTLPPLSDKSDTAGSAANKTDTTTNESRKLKVRHTKKTSKAKAKVNKNASATETRKTDNPAIVVSHTIEDDTKPKRFRVRHTKKTAQVLSNTSMAKSANSDILVITHDTPVTSVESSPLPPTTTSPGLSKSRLEERYRYSIADEWYCSGHEGDIVSGKSSGDRSSSTRKSISLEASTTYTSSFDNVVYPGYRAKRCPVINNPPSDITSEINTINRQESCFRFRAERGLNETSSPGFGALVDDYPKSKSTKTLPTFTDTKNANDEFKFHATNTYTSGHRHGMKSPAIIHSRPVTQVFSHADSKCSSNQKRPLSISPKSTVSDRCTTATPGSARLSCISSGTTIKSVCSAARSSVGRI